MRKVLERVNERLQGFVSQRDDLALVVRCSQTESILILKILENGEESSSTEMYWIFAEPFRNPDDYATTLVDTFAAKNDAVRILQEKEGMPIWPSFPEGLKNAKSPPAQRIRDLMVLARALLPAPEGLVVVWVMLPLEMADHEGYALLMREVLRHEFPFPWCHHIRTIVRDDSAHPVLSQKLAKVPRLAWYEPDLSPRAMEQSLDEEVEDPELPLEQRLQAVLLTAGMDYSHKRYDQALSKYQLLFKYFAGKGNLAMSALILNGMGEVHLARGNKGEAVECFQAALIPAAEGPSPPLPVLTNVVLNLANLRMSEKNWAEAESYYVELQKLATIQRNPPLKVTAIENLGQTQYEQGKIPAALESWEAGASVAEKLELPAQHKSLLERLGKHYRRVGDRAKQREVEQRLAGTANASSASGR